MSTLGTDKQTQRQLYSYYIITLSMFASPRVKSTSLGLCLLCWLGIYLNLLVVFVQVNMIYKGQTNKIYCCSARRVKIISRPKNFLQVHVIQMQWLKLRLSVCGWQSKLFLAARCYLGPKLSAALQRSLSVVFSLI